jgi:solute carrier family 35, member C2
MCKSSVLGFVLLFAFLFRLEKPSWKLGGIITAMTIGVLMMVAGETAFNALGFMLVMAASMSSGFRWSLTQILLIRHPATSNPFSSIFFLAPVMFITLLIIAVPVEGLWDVHKAFVVMGEERGFLLSLCILLFPGCLAFMMTASEFALLQRTSVVTLSICGIFKEVLTISTASVVFGDELTPINATGLIVTIATIAAYNVIKVRKMREDAKLDAHHMVYNQEYAPVLSTDPDTQPGASNGRVTTNVAASSARTDDLLTSLNIPVRTSPQFRPATDSPRMSPVKRPEDLE